MKNIAAYSINSNTSDIIWSIDLIGRLYCGTIALGLSLNAVPHYPYSYASLFRLVLVVSGLLIHIVFFTTILTICVIQAILGLILEFILLILLLLVAQVSIITLLLVFFILPRQFLPSSSLFWWSHLCFVHECFKFRRYFGCCRY